MLWTALAWGVSDFLLYLPLFYALEPSLRGFSSAFRDALLAVPQGALFGFLLLPALKKDPGSAS